MIKDRIIEFVIYLGISTRQFELNCGFSNGMVNKIGDNIRKVSVDKISKRYPQLNINWLKTGEGNMLKDYNSEYTTDNSKYTVSEPEILYRKSITDDHSLMITIVKKLTEANERISRSIEKMIETNERNSRSVEKMVQTADRYSRMIEKLVDILNKNGIEITNNNNQSHE